MNAEARAMDGAAWVGGCVAGLVVMALGLGWRARAYQAHVQALSTPGAQLVHDELETRVEQLQVALRAQAQIRTQELAQASARQVVQRDFHLDAATLQRLQRFAVLADDPTGTLLRRIF